MSIQRNLWIFAALTCLVFTSIAARAATPPYDAIYVFGDSYCDVGNIYAATDFTYPPPPYFEGRFSNGPIWVEHIASAWGLSMKASAAGGTDYAVGGAYVTSDQTASLGTFHGVIPSVPHQVELYLSLHRGHADPNALYVIEGGGNDILGASNVSADYLGYQIALGISESELALRRAGAQHFLIPDLLDVGQLPAATAEGPVFASFASATTVATNKALDLLLGFEGFLERVRIHRLDVFSLFHDIAADSTPLTSPPSTLVSHFGFTNIITPCLIPTPCLDPDHTLFWDIEHPTEFGHAFFAVAVEASLGPRP
jgi:phospholipase/lecithinase/hemolysin